MLLHSATGIAAVKISYQWVLEGTDDFTCESDRPPPPFDIGKTQR